MTDPDLLMLGCGVTFIAIGGAYVYLRERFMAREEARRVVPVRNAPRRRSRRRAA